MRKLPIDHIVALTLQREGPLGGPELQQLADTSPASMTRVMADSDTFTTQILPAKLYYLRSAKAPPTIIAFMRYHLWAIARLISRYHRLQREMPTSAVEAIIIGEYEEHINRMAVRLHDLKGGTEIEHSS